MNGMAKVLKAAFNSNNTSSLDDYEDDDPGWFFKNLSLTFNVQQQSCVINNYFNLELPVTEFEYLLELARHPDEYINEEQLPLYSGDRRNKKQSSKRIKCRIIAKFKELVEKENLPFSKRFEFIKNRRGIGYKINFKRSQIRIIE